MKTFQVSTVKSVFRIKEIHMKIGGDQVKSYTKSTILNINMKSTH